MKQQGKSDKARCGLRSISFIECVGLKDSGVIQLAKSFPYVEELNLSWCWDITDVGLDAVVTRCQEIHTLRLVGLKEATCQCIITKPLLPKLRVLDLEQIDLVDDDQLKVMKNTRPWLSITSYYGEEVLVEEG